MGPPRHWGSDYVYAPPRRTRRVLNNIFERQSPQEPAQHAPLAKARVDEEEPVAAPALAPEAAEGELAASSAEDEGEGAGASAAGVVNSLGQAGGLAGAEPATLAADGAAGARDKGGHPADVALAAEEALGEEGELAVPDAADGLAAASSRGKEGHPADVALAAEEALEEEGELLAPTADGAPAASARDKGRHGEGEPLEEIEEVESEPEVPAAALDGEQEEDSDSDSSSESTSDAESDEGRDDGPCLAAAGPPLAEAASAEPPLAEAASPASVIIVSPPAGAPASPEPGGARVSFASPAHVYCAGRYPHSPHASPLPGPAALLSSLPPTHSRRC